MTFRQLLRFWPFSLLHERSIQTCESQSAEPDVIPVPPEEAGWEDYQCYLAALHRQQNRRR